jgi:small-conductance mechanosensitive channel
MKIYEIQILETLVVLVLWLLTNFFVKRTIQRIVRNFHVASERRRIILRLVNFIVFLLAVVSFTAVWGVDQHQILLFFTSTITVLGIAFFAQWSILSNITAGLVIFFSHPLRLGDYIKIIEKDYLIEGKLEHISFFFMHILTESGERITIPNSVALQKTISIRNRDQEPWI